MKLILFKDFRYPLKPILFTFKILKGRSCWPVSRRGKSFATLETLIALRQIWPWWARWTGGAPFVFDVFVFVAFVFVFVFAVFVFSFLRWHQKWHAWNGALPTKTSLQSGLDPLIFFAPIHQVSVSWSLYQASIFSSLWSRFTGFLHSEEPRLAWNEPRSSVIAFLPSGVVILLRKSSKVTLFGECQLQFKGFV